MLDFKLVNDLAQAVAHTHIIRILKLFAWVSCPAKRSLMGSVKVLSCAERLQVWACDLGAGMATQPPTPRRRLRSVGLTFIALCAILLAPTVSELAGYSLLPWASLQYAPQTTC